MRRVNWFISTTMIISLIVSMVLSLYAGDKQKHPDVEKFNELSCMECHSEVTPEITNAWKSSKHGMMNFGCYMCHGDGVESFKPQPTTERCVGCHSDKQVNFEKLKVNSCFDCHSGHTLKFHSSENE